MKNLKKLAVAVMIFLLSIPVNSIAAEAHTHSFVTSIGQGTTSSSE